MKLLDGDLLRELSGVVAERMGLHFPEERWPDLARGLKTAGEELTCGRFVESVRAMTGA